MAILCGTPGNFFTGKSVADQTEAEFLSITMLWNQLIFCASSLGAQAAVLIRNRFVDQPDRPAGYLLCLKRVVRATYIVDILTVLSPIANIFALSAVTSDDSCMLRLGFYVNCFAALAFTVITTIAVHRIFIETTVAGIERQDKRARGSRPVVPAHGSRWRRQLRRLLRMTIQASPGMIWNAFAGAYVQVTTANMPTSQRDLAIFAICSIALKLIIQELIKLAIVKHKVRDIRTMFLVVAVPTVLIDTQVRVMLQLANNVRTTVGGSIAMAFAEIAMRTGKMLFLRIQIKRKSLQVQGFTPINGAKHAASVRPTNGNRTGRRSTIGFEIWKMQLLRFHAAEAYADMAAEYIALGSSAMIVSLYDDHPKYQLEQWQVHAVHGESGASVSDSRYFILLAIQVVIELFVDTVSCIVETANGANFEELRRYDSFVMALFIVIGVMNAQITAIMYLRCK